MVVKFISVGLLSFALSQEVYSTETARCHSKLFPKESGLCKAPDDLSSKLSSKLLKELEKRANEALAKESNPIETLASAGVTDKKDSGLVASRKVFSDSERSALLAIAYVVTKKDEYLEKAKSILLGMAEINKPTGHPVDEVQLEGMIWAYDLLHRQFSKEERAKIKTWFESLYAAKKNWSFGPKTQNNNHHTHQLKIMLMLDKVLKHRDRLESDVSDAKEHLKNNIDSEGSTIDYKERDALHYHNYDLQSWLVIALISEVPQDLILKAFDFMAERIRSGDIGGEFENSTAPIDKKRGDAGFDYAKKGGNFDVSKAASTILLHEVVKGESSEEALATVVKEAKASDWLTFLKVLHALWGAHGG